MQLKTILKAAVNSMVRGHHQPKCYSGNNLERTATIEIENIDFASEYAEPGYNNPTKGILFANWNNLPSELIDILEKAGYAIEWSDEWINCYACNRAVRTSPDSYGWRKSYVIYDDCEIFCADCVQNDLDKYEDYLLNQTHKADTFDVNWEARGFGKLNKDHYEAGLHPHQTDKPEVIAKSVPKNCDYLFAVPAVGQFDVMFDCWIRKKSS